ncbi:MAG: ROK family glucokinase [Eubacteriaceae bacterium]
MGKYAFGIDIGGTTVKIGMFEEKGTLIESWEIPTRRENKGEFILADITGAVEQKLQETGISKADVLGIGMGVPGPVGGDGTVFTCVNLGWGQFNIEKSMEQQTGLRVKAGNDANVAALGEMWQGGGKGRDNIVMVTLGTGVGGGIIIDGKILAGNDGAAGEIGHLPAKEGETEVCGCGKKGCLEQYASASGVAKEAVKYLRDHPDEASVLKELDEITAKDVFDAAKQGDKPALAIVDATGKLLGKALASVACVVNPQGFVIGGGMANAGTILIDCIKKYYAQYAFPATRNVAFELACLGNKAGIYGSVKQVLA